MAFDESLAMAILQTMSQQGWTLPRLTSPLSNPLHVVFEKESSRLQLLIYARRITPQARGGPDPSTHNRPMGEMHLQMLFDGDQRGAGIKNHLRFEPDTRTLLLGYFEYRSGDYIIAAFDPSHHAEYAYSKSLQLKQGALEQAITSGIAFQRRQTDETVVLFQHDMLLEYLDYATDLHGLTLEDAQEISAEELVPVPVRKITAATFAPSDLPDLPVSDRRRSVAEVGHYVRSHLFDKAIKSVYERCAICGFQYDYVLDAAHIVPVSEGGTDTYDNGFGLCPNCHRMYDRGYILVDEAFRIFINPKHAEEYDQAGLADSLPTLRKTLRETLWLPSDPRFHPSGENLRRTFLSRRG